ncbi:MAG: hypothetical protein JOZ20_06985 [Sphingomonas sp.]|nr:hypothetical protein [Sphingomonas sp.]
MSGLLAIAMFAASLPGSYDCTIDRQAMITEAGASDQQVQFPESDRANWRFSVRVPEGRAPEVTIDWPANPIQIAGRHPSLDIAPGQVAMFALSNGPCMFTESACMAMIELTAHQDGSLGYSILPAGSSRNSDGTRTLLHVAFLGTCHRREGAAR